MKKQQKQVKVTIKITSEALKDVAINLYVLKFYQIIYEEKKNPIPLGMPLSYAEKWDTIPLSGF